MASNFVPKFSRFTDRRLTKKKDKLSGILSEIAELEKARDNGQELTDSDEAKIKRKAKTEAELAKVEEKLQKVSVQE